MRSRLVKFTVAFTVALVGAGAYAASPVLQEIEQAFIRLGEQVRPSVVNIDAESRMGDRVPPELREEYEDLFRLFGISPEDAPRRMEERMVPSQGSGFIFDKQGHIITNNHVVADATTLTVRLWDGDEYKATVVGRDPQTDLAVIKINATRDLPVAVLGDSDAVKVGQFAIALGSPQGLEGSFSFGHVTALGRNNLRLPGLRFQNFLQTDAAINLGNSGGPLVDIDGEVIGINTAIVFGAESLGFANTINVAKKIIPVLIADGSIKRGYLGVQIQDAADFAEAEGLPDKMGAYVIDVSEDTPAARAGVQSYDVIRRVNGEEVSTAADLQSRISDFAPDAKVQLEVWREGENKTLEVQLAEFPDAVEVARDNRDVMGLNVRPLAPEIAERLGLEEGTTGVVVSAVEPGSDAYDAGVRQGDIITEVAKEEVRSVDDFNRLMGEHARPGSSVILRVQRGNGPSSILVLKVSQVATEQ